MNLLSSANYQNTNRQNLYRTFFNNLQFVELLNMLRATTTQARRKTRIVKAAVKRLGRRKSR